MVNNNKWENSQSKYMRAKKRNLHTFLYTLACEVVSFEIEWSLCLEANCLVTGHLLVIINQGTAIDLESAIR